MMNNPMSPYPGSFGPSMIPTQPVMPTSVPGPGFNPYVPGNFPAPQPSTQPAEFDWIRVNNLDDVRNVTVPPNGKAWIMLQNDPIFVVKTADAMGLATTQAFRFEPYNPPAPQTQQTSAQGEFAPLSVVQQMQARLDQLTTELDTLKGGTQNGKPVKQSVSTTAANG